MNIFNSYKIRLKRKFRVARRLKPDANIWYSGFIDGEEYMSFRRKDDTPNMRFVPKYRATTGFDTERQRFSVRPIKEFGLYNIGWRKGHNSFLMPKFKPWES